MALFTEKGKDATGPAADLDMTMRVKRPGYCPATQTGVEAQGSPKGFGDNTYNPETVFGLSYYYYAPTCDIEGRVSIGDQKHNVKGEAWFEHQWGNYGTADFMGHAYVWLWFGLDDGTKFSCRYWTLPVTFEPVTRFNRSVYHTPEGQVQHFQGSDAVKISVLRHWASPASGLRYPISLLLETPAGIFALEPDFDEQEAYIPHADTYLWEGACRVRGGSLGGPVIGKAYLELPPGAKENLQAKVLNKPYAMKR